MSANLENSAVATGWKRSVFIPIPKKGNAKECSNYCTIVLISHASKIMLKILQARLQQYVNCELPYIQAGFRKGRGTRDQIANICWIIKKIREFKINICCCCCCVASVVSDSVRPHRQQPTRLPHPWDSPGKNTGVSCHFLLQCMKVKRESEVTHSCLTLSDCMEFSLPGSSVHGIFQARVLEWVAIAFPEINIYFCFIDYAKAFDCVDHNKMWKILKEMGIPDHLTCPLRNLYAGQEATVRTGHGTTDWFQIRKGVCQGCILSPYLFNVYAEYIMRNAGLDEAQAGIKIAGRNINNLRYADDTILMAESEELKSLLMKMKEESEKVGLKLNIQKTKIMASSPITSYQIDGETMETVTIYFGGSKITADGDSSHEIKRCLLLGRKVMTNLDSILKSRDITLPTNVHLVKTMGFPVAMYGCES
uniref:RNA-directed DNA polymerase n=1 Tax=Bos mutus grunniens TaxID=30521 RepID=A0A8C0AC82_BOSMU